MSALKPIAPALLLALLLPASAGAQGKVFLCPTTSTVTVAGGDTRASYALDNAEKTAAKLQARNVSTQVVAGGSASTAAVDAANDFDADAFVMVSSQATANAHGFESWYYSPSATGLALAQSVQTALAAAYPMVDRPSNGNRGAKSDATHDAWPVLKSTLMPAVATFVLFDDCVTAHASLPGGASESAFLRSASGRDVIAGALESGLCAWSGLTCGTSGPCVPSTEICDGKDNDCDGQTDEGNPGAGASCTTGSPGICGPGTKACVSGALVCQPTVTPTTETCNSVDDDCDGAVDDGVAGVGVSCQTGAPGLCASGTRRCVSGSLVCQPNATSTTESCNGIDDDCDGTVDDGIAGVGAACQTGAPGICATGTRRCVSGTLSCQPNASSGVESCNGTDDDCDGQVDEENPGGGQSCSTGGVGECGRGTTACQGGRVSCVQSGIAGEELCDGKDNDCDGQTDEGNPGAGELCATGLKGVCGVGRRTCSSGSIVCEPDVQPSAELCDGLDNDCDGATDEEAGGGGVCSTGLPGACGQGELRCVGSTLNCVQTVQPVAESCDGVDNDCNGRIDDAPGCPGVPDAGAADADAGSVPDAGAPAADAGRADAGESPEPILVSESGCGCTAGADGSGLLALFALVGLRRRRR